MPDRSSDQVIQHAREIRPKQIEDFKSCCTQDPGATLKGLKTISAQLTKLIASEFD
jgi:hypothetical protein